MHQVLCPSFIYIFNRFILNKILQYNILLGKCVNIKKKTSEFAFNIHLLLQEAWLISQSIYLYTTKSTYSFLKKIIHSCFQPFYVSTETSNRNTERRQYYSDSPFQQLNSGNLSSDITDTTGTTNNHGNAEETLNGHEDIDSCCVCQDAEMTIVLLPCRHGCVCSGCFVKLDKCPVCRDVFTSYFRLKDFSQQMSQPLREQNLGQPSVPHVIANNWWERFNERLNSYFGFT